MRQLGLLLLMLQALACSRSASPPTADPKPRLPETEPSKALTEPGSTRMVISVRKNSPGNMNAVSEYCIQGDADKTQAPQIYQGLPYRLDGINVRFPAGTSPELIEKSPALLVTMTRKPDLGSALVRTDRTCDPSDPPMAQARSDWGTPECGQRSPCITTLAALAKFSYWEVSAVEAFSGLTVTEAADGQSLQVKVSNIFGSRQGALELTAHYEGGSGKPMPQFIKFPVPGLEPGASFEAQVHRTVDASGAPVTTPPGHRSRFFDLATLDLQGSLKDGQTEIPVRLSVFLHLLFPINRDGLPGK